MDGRCETCRYWTKFRDDPYGHCAYPGDSDTLAPREPQERKAFIVHEVDAFTAELYTAPDFGCVQWGKDEEGE